jgi:signal transduction histidine kinase
LLMVISDNGCGLPTQTEERGMGLLNLQYRARAIAAKLQIQSAQGQGTTIRCRVPSLSLAKFKVDCSLPQFPLCTP